MAVACHLWLRSTGCWLSGIFTEESFEDKKAQMGRQH